MCRHLAYLGVPRSPAEAVLRAPHSLLVQSYRPQDMRAGGTVNADGCGFGWFHEGTDPVRYRRAQPLWADEVLPQLVETVHTSTFVAAVRSATPGLPVTDTACAPFTGDGWLFSHNGVVRGWPESVAGLAGRLPIADLLRIEAPTDSALLWALLRHHLRAGTDPARAVEELTMEVEHAAPDSRLNFLLAGSHMMIATAWVHSLLICKQPDGVLVASEPCDENSAWRPVPDRHLVVVHRDTPHEVELHPMGSMA